MKSQRKESGEHENPTPSNGPSTIKHRFISKTLECRIYEFSVAEMEYYIANWNGNNLRKKVNWKKVGEYARDMRAGKFRVASAVFFDWFGNLIDGQHRFWAAIEAGMALTIVVVYGLDPEAAQNMDGHAVRTLAVHLGLQGEKNGTTMAGIANCWTQHETGVLKPTAAEVERIFVANRDCIEHVAASGKGAFNKAGFLAAVAMRMVAEPERMELFLAKVTGSGAGMEENSPELKMREYLKRPLRKGGGGGLKDDYEIAAFAIDKFLKGEQVTVLRRPRSAQRSGAVSRPAAPSKHKPTHGEARPELDIDTAFLGEIDFHYIMGGGDDPVLDLETNAIGEMGLPENEEPASPPAVMVETVMAVSAKPKTYSLEELKSEAIDAKG